MNACGTFTRAFAARVTRPLTQMAKVQGCTHEVFGTSRIDDCLDPCRLPEYAVSGRKSYLPGQPDNISQVDMYFFNIDEMVEEEYVLVDLSAIVESVGGSLGMFLGFSFYDFVLLLVRKKLRS